MYYPYFHGKQFDLIAIRDMAELMSGCNFVPIIEPVKSTKNGIRGLVRTIDSVVEVDGRAIVVVNPDHGDFLGNISTILELLNDNYNDEPNICVGVQLYNGMKIEEIDHIFSNANDFDCYFIHNGYDSADELLEYIGDNLSNTKHIFVENKTNEDYINAFLGTKEKILLRDSFHQLKNAEYEPCDYFSDLHKKYEDKGFNGFGDYMIAGNSYSESGGPAYAVAIHITYINHAKQDNMYMYNFISDNRDTPTDTPEKFLEAVNHLVEKTADPSSDIIETEAIKNFRKLASEKHFPALGVVKKLSMEHHIETMADYFY